MEIIDIEEFTTFDSIMELVLNLTFSSFASLVELKLHIFITGADGNASVLIG